eukprot:355371-Chlamydomonas_euryale.AAC.3
MKNKNWVNALAPTTLPCLRLLRRTATATLSRRSSCSTSCSAASTYATTAASTYCRLPGGCSTSNWSRCCARHISARLAVTLTHRRRPGNPSRVGFHAPSACLPCGFSTSCWSQCFAPHTSACPVGNGMHRRRLSHCRNPGWRPRLIGLPASYFLVRAELYWLEQGGMMSQHVLRFRRPPLHVRRRGGASGEVQLCPLQFWPFPLPKTALLASVLELGVAGRAFLARENQPCVVKRFARGVFWGSACLPPRAYPLCAEGKRVSATAGVESVSPSGVRLHPLRCFAEVGASARSVLVDGALHEAHSRAHRAWPPNFAAGDALTCSCSAAGPECRQAAPHERDRCQL